MAFLSIGYNSPITACSHDAAGCLSQGIRWAWVVTQLPLRQNIPIVRCKCQPRNCPAWQLIHTLLTILPWRENKPSCQHFPTSTRPNSEGFTTCLSIMSTRMPCVHWPCTHSGVLNPLVCTSKATQRETTHSNQHCLGPREYMASRAKFN